MNGLIHIYEGDGKGKTSAGIGLCIRCAGSGERVLYTQFLKDNTSNELSILKNIDLITVKSCEKSFGFIFQMTDEQKKEAAQYYQNYLESILDELKNKKYRLVVFDEIIASYNLKMIKSDTLLEFLKNKPKDLEIVLTGRDPAEELIQLADYISCIKKIKHPFDIGVPARIGIEY